MDNQLSGDLKPVLEACKQIGKSDEFSMKRLHDAGYQFHWTKLMQLVRLGYLSVSHNGIVRRGTAWYRVV